MLISRYYESNIFNTKYENIIFFQSVLGKENSARSSKIWFSFTWIVRTITSGWPSHVVIF